MVFPSQSRKRHPSLGYLTTIWVSIGKCCVSFLSLGHSRSPPRNQNTFDADSYAVPAGYVEKVAADFVDLTRTD